MRKAVFLDRDGVINETIWRLGKPQAPYTLEEFKLHKGVVEGTHLLKKAGFLLVVVTNQPDVARGWVSKKAVDEVNAEVLKLLPIDELKVCFHTDKDHCDCRKPQPGMLVNAMGDWGINPSLSYMIGDRASDIEAGFRAGCRTILVGRSDDSFPFKPDYECGSLLAAAELITAGI